MAKANLNGNLFYPRVKTRGKAKRIVAIQKYRSLKSRRDGIIITKIMRGNDNPEGVI